MVVRSGAPHGVAGWNSRQEKYGPASVAALVAVDELFHFSRRGAQRRMRHRSHTSAE